MDKQKECLIYQSDCNCYYCSGYSKALEDVEKYLDKIDIE